MEDREPLLDAVHGGEDSPKVHLKRWLSEEWMQERMKVVRSRTHTVAEGSKPVVDDGIPVELGGQTVHITMERSTKREVGMHTVRWPALNLVRLVIKDSLLASTFDTVDVLSFRESIVEALNDFSSLSRSVTVVSSRSWSVTVEQFARNREAQLVGFFLASADECKDLETLETRLNDLKKNGLNDLKKGHADLSLDGRLLTKLNELGLVDPSIEAKKIDLPPGSTNLYKYPRISFESGPSADEASKRIRVNTDPSCHISGRASRNASGTWAQDTDVSTRHSLSKASEAESADKDKHEVIVKPHLDHPNILALDGLLTAMAKGKESRERCFEQPDSVGARAIHALLVANTSASCQLALKLFEQDFLDEAKGTRWLVTQTHGFRDGKRPTGEDQFEGENCFHIVAANAKEDVLLSMLELLKEAWVRDEQWQKQVAEILVQKATGSFFDGEPMCFFGSTPVAFAATFGLQEAVRKMYEIIDKSKLSDSDTRLRDERTGFLPLHAVVASAPHMLHKKDEGKAASEMCNLLIDEARQDWNETTKLGVRSQRYNETDEHYEKLCETHERKLATRQQIELMDGLTPLQLSVRVGCPKAVVESLVRRQSRVNWIWGNLHSYSIDLQGIDSATKPHETSVMELIGRVDAAEATQKLLLDEFLNGLLFKLFEAKRNKINKIGLIMYVPTLVSFVYAYLLWRLAFSVKEEPLPRRYQGQITQVTVASFLSIIVSLILSIATYSREGESKRLNKEGSLLGMLFSFPRWALTNPRPMRYLWIRFLAVVFALLSCMTLNSVDPARAERVAQERGRWFVEESSRAPSALEQQEDGSTAAASGVEMDDPFESVWFTLGAALFFEIFYFTDAVLRNFGKLIIFKYALFEIAWEDSRTFLAVFFLLLLNFYCVLYVMYPRAGEESLPMVVEFNNWWDGLVALTQLALAGEALDININQQDLQRLSWWELFELFAFGLFYMTYILIALVLLLNLLIAMMNGRYQLAAAKAEIERRVIYAREVLRLEAIVNFVACQPSTNVGKKKDEKRGTRWYHEPEPSSDIFLNASHLWDEKERSDKEEQEKARREKDEQEKVRREEEERSRKKAEEEKLANIEQQLLDVRERLLQLHKAHGMAPAAAEPKEEAAAAAAERAEETSARVPAPEPAKARPETKVRPSALDSASFSARSSSGSAPPLPPLPEGQGSPMGHAMAVRFAKKSPRAAASPSPSP